MLGHLDDLASDFSAIHRVGDMGAMPSRVFFALAPRLAAYQGVIRAVLASGPPAAQRAGAAARSVDPAAVPGVVVADTATLLSHPAFRPMPGEAPAVTVTGGGGGA